jgi:hypothetical protein
MVSFGASIFVRQYGHVYGSEEFWLRFWVLIGASKTFSHEGFGHVYVLFSLLLFFELDSEKVS